MYEGEFSKESEPAITLVVWFQSLNSILRDPESFLKAGLTFTREEWDRAEDDGTTAEVLKREHERVSEQIYADRARYRVHDINRLLLDSITQAKVLRPAYLKRRALSALYLARGSLDAGRLDFEIRHSYQIGCFEWVRERCRDRAMYCSQVCGDQFLRLAADLCAWLEMEGIEPPQPSACEQLRHLLSPMEFRLVEYLWLHKSASFTELEDRVWGKQLQAPADAITQCVKRANSKLTNHHVALRIKNGGVLLDM